MNSVLFLLFLLSLTTFSSKFTLKGDIGSTLSAPIFILSGYLISPHVLGIVLPSIVSSSTSAIRFAVFLISFLIGFQALNKNVAFPNEKTVRREFSGNIIFIFSLLALTASGVFVQYKFDTLTVKHETVLDIVGAIIILLGLFFKGSSFIPVILVTLGNMLMQYGGFNMGAINFILISIGIIATLALCTILLVGKSSTKSTPFILGLLGILILGSGFAASAHISESLIGYFLGVALFYYYKDHPFHRINFREIETPFLLFIYIFMGFHLHIEWGSFSLGALLAIFRILFITISQVDREEIRIQPISIPLAFSLFLINLPLLDLEIGLDQKLLSSSGISIPSYFLSTLTAGLIVTEIVGLPIVMKSAKRYINDPAEDEKGASHHEP